MKTSCWVLVASLTIAGCATTIEGPRRVQGAIPDVGATNTARVGDEIYVSFSALEYERGDRIVTTSPVEGSVGLGKVLVPEGSELKKESESKYCSVGKFYHDPLAGPYSQACFLDEDGDGRFEKVGARPGLVMFWSNLANPINYEARGADTLVLGDGGYKRELVYQGIDGNTLRINYREYADNLARPAFFQDLTYPIVDGKASIIFRDLKIDASSITPTEITYSVIEGSL